MYNSKKNSETTVITKKAGLGSGLNSYFGFKLFSEHETQQMCSVNRPISPNKRINNHRVRNFDISNFDYLI